VDQAEKIETDARRPGITRDVRELLGASRKKEAKRVADRMTLTKTDFTSLVLNCADLRLSHHKKHLQFVPQELASRRENGDEFRRVRAIFQQRKNRVVHFFSNMDSWHCFTFTYNDVFGDAQTGRHHWEMGAHVHYTSHLFTHLDRKTVWESLVNRNAEFSGVHIRWAD
jgi:hypothetical protein